MQLFLVVGGVEVGVNSGRYLVVGIWWSVFRSQFFLASGRGSHIRLMRKNKHRNLETNKSFSEQ